MNKNWKTEHRKAKNLSITKLNEPDENIEEKESLCVFKKDCIKVHFFGSIL